MVNMAEFVLTLETIEHLYKYSDVNILTEADAASKAEAAKGIIGKAIDYLKDLWQKISDWFGTEYYQFKTLIKEGNPLVKASLIIALGSVVILIVTAITKAMTSESKEFFVIDAPVTKESNETVQTESDGLIIKPVREDVYGVSTYASGVPAPNVALILVLLGLICILIAKKLAATDKLKLIIAAWSVLQVAAAIYVAYTIGYYETIEDVQSAPTPELKKINLALSLIIAGMAAIVGVSVTLPAIKAFIAGTSINVNVDTMKVTEEVSKEFDNIKDNPQANELKSKIGKLSEKAAKTVE